jgi:hypothetical protein
VSELAGAVVVGVALAYLLVLAAVGGESGPGGGQFMDGGAGDGGGDGLG